MVASQERQDRDPIHRIPIALLALAGQPAQGPLRIFVGIATGEVSDEFAYDWPLVTPIDNFFVPFSESDSATGLSKRVSAPEDVATLISLGETWMQERSMYVTAPEFGVPIKGGYILFMRSDLPFSNEYGLVELTCGPWAPCYAEP